MGFVNNSTEEKYDFVLNAESDENRSDHDVSSNYTMMGARLPVNTLKHESNFKNDETVENTAFNFYETITTLQEMASFTVAIALWNRFIKAGILDHNVYSKGFHTGEFLSAKDEKNVEQLLQHLPVPRAIREIIGESLRYVRHEMNKWANPYKSFIFNNSHATSKSSPNTCDLLFCFWLPNGKIDYRKSALNMLSNPRLMIEDKFKIMTHYCLEDEMNKLSLDSLPESFIKSINFEGDPLILYWIYNMKGELNELAKMINLSTSIESFFLTICYTYNWSSIEYFWTRASVNEQIPSALWLLEHKSEFQVQLISKMNESQKRYVLSKIPCTIIKNFWSQSYPRFGFSTWIHFKDVINLTQFKDLVYSLLRLALPDNSENIEYLVKLWNSASDDLRKDSLQSLVSKVIDLHSNGYYRRSPCSFHFLKVFLCSGTMEFRKRYLYKYAQQWIIDNDVSSVDQLIKSCLPDVNDTVELGNHLLKSPIVRKHCLFILVGKYVAFQRWRNFFSLNRELDNVKWLGNFINHYCCDSKAKIGFINGFLQSCEGTNKWKNSCKLVEHLDFSPDEALTFKNHIIWSFVNVHTVCTSCHNDVRQFFVEITGDIDAEEVKKCKNKAVESLTLNYNWIMYDQKVIHEFLHWCYDNDDRKVERFRKSLSVDAIFEYWCIAWEKAGYLENGARSKEMLDELSQLDRILLWYFGSLEDVKMYKMGKKVDFFDRVCSQMNEDFDRDVLTWFFEGSRDKS